MENNKNLNKKFPTSRTGLSKNFLEYSTRIILFRLVNNKTGKSFNYFENAKFSTSIKDLLFSTDYRTVDYQHDTLLNKKFNTIKLLVDTVNITKENKATIEDLIKSNKNYLLENKTFPNRKSIEENIKYFEEKINSL
tara:strand:- start:63 stop:473 length:411 start_codon:yes stop_codon:yes gene_type:complete